jgi:hypothetical protein
MRFLLGCALARVLAFLKLKLAEDGTHAHTWSPCAKSDLETELHSIASVPHRHEHAAWANMINRMAAVLQPGGESLVA